MKITREGRNAIGGLWSGLGGDPELPPGEEPISCCDPIDPADLPDRALGLPVFYPSVGVGSGDIVQDDVSSVAAGGPHASITTNFGSTPTAGNTLMAWCMVNKNGAQAANVTPSGWTKRNIALHHANGGASGFELALYTKVSDGTETGVTVAAGAGTGFTWATLYIAEIGGSFGGYAEDVTFVNVNTATLPSITPTAGIPALVMGAAVATNAYAMSGGPSGYTLVLDDANANTGSSGRINVWKRVEDPTAGSYGGSISWSGGSVTFIMTEQVWFSATLESIQAGSMTDGDDATYDQVSGTDVLRIDLGGPFRIVRARLLIGSENAGSVTYTVRGANVADFSDAVALGAVTYSATGGYTADDNELLWSTASSYRYFELIGPAESRRVYSFELYEASVVAGQDHTHDAIEAEIAAHAADTSDAHDASAVSIADAGGYTATTDAEAALQELYAQVPQVRVQLANKSGGSVAAGDVVVIDTANDTAFTTTTTGQAEVSVGVALATIANNATGPVLVSGYAALVNVPSSMTRGRYIETHTVAKQATGSATRRAGSFGQFLTGGTTPAAWLWGQTDQTAGGGSALTVEEVDGSPTDSAVTKIVFPNGTLGIASHVATYTPAAGAGGATAFIGARAVAGSGQSIANNTDVAMTLTSTESYDSDGFHDTSSNTSRMTIPAGLGGKYLVIGQASWPQNASGDRYIYIRKNGTTGFNQTYERASVNWKSRQQATDVLDLAAGDYIEIVIGQDSGGSLTLEGGSFEIAKLDSGKVGAGIGCRAYNQTAVQAVANSTGVIVTYPTEEFDTDGFHSTSVNTGRMTVPAGLGGKYLVAAIVRWPGTGGGTQRNFTITKNGNIVPGGMAFVAPPANPVTTSASIVLDLLAGDYIEVVAFQDSGGSLNIGGTNTYDAASLSIMRLDSGSSNSLTPTSATLTSGDITLTQNTYTDVISLSLGPGTWMIWAQANLYSTSGAQDVTARLYDSTNAASISNGSMSMAATGYDETIMLVGQIVLTGTATIKLQATGSGSGGAKALRATQTNSAGNVATQMQALKVA